MLKNEKYKRNTIGLLLQSPISLESFCKI